MTGDIAVRRQCNAIQGAIQVKIKMKSLSFLSKLKKIYFGVKKLNESCTKWTFDRKTSVVLFLSLIFNNFIEVFL